MSKTRTIAELLIITRDVALRLQATGQTHACLCQARVEIRRLRSILCMFCEA